MSEQNLHPTIITLPRPSHQYSLLEAEDGSLLGLTEHGELIQSLEAGNHVIWNFCGNEIKHTVSGQVLSQEAHRNRFIFSIGTRKVQFQRRLGPEKLPSAYLEELRKKGWTCLNSILSREIVDGLEQVACTGPYEDQEQNSGVSELCQHVAVGRSIAEPISLWVLREYLQT